MKQEDIDLLDGIREHTLVGVREYTDGDLVELRRNLKTGRSMITASNEGGNNITQVDLLDLFDWMRYGPPDRRTEFGFIISNGG